jgi:hypothetical protein
MMRRIIGSLLVVAAMAVGLGLSSNSAEAAGRGQPYDWQRFYYYPYVYYPHNFHSPVEYNNLYYRYPQERRIPVYNSAWHNFYLMPKPYYRGNGFKLDVF